VGFTYPKINEIGRIDELRNETTEFVKSGIKTAARCDLEKTFSV
jgi:hypothetical protein